jgi:hypothetical protein
MTKDTVERRERLLKVCKNIINNPRRVDVDAVAAFRKAVLRYADVQNIDRGQALKIYDSEGEVGVMVREAFDVLDASNMLKELDDRQRSSSTGAAYPRNRWYLDLLRDPDDIDEDDADADADADADEVGKANHHASVVADLLVESGRFTDRPEALHHLLHKPAGQALLARMKKAAKTKESNMDSIHSIMKSGGIGPTCAAIVAKGSTSISEHELVAAATAVAHERHPGLSASAAFAKVYADQGDEGRVLREAVNVAKVSQWLAGGSTVRAKAVDIGSNSAYGELMSKAEEYRNAHPELSISQAFEKIYQARDNVELAKRERIESALR